MTSALLIMSGKFTQIASFEIKELKASFSEVFDAFNYCETETQQTGHICPN